MTLLKPHRPRVHILGDSVVKFVQGRTLSTPVEAKVSVYSYSGSTVDDMLDHIKPALRRKPDELIVCRCVLLTVINALVFSKLHYCSNVWANTTERNVRKLQNFAYRIVCGARKYDHVTLHLKSSSWLPIKDQLYHRQVIMAFKCISGNALKYLTSEFITREQVTKRTTRSGQKLNIPLFKTASGQRTCYYRTIGLWNNLEPFLKPNRSVQVFKRILKNKLLDNFVNAS